MFVMTVLGHDTAFMTQTDDVILYFKISFISALLAGSLSAITPLHFPPVHFVVLSSLNSLITKTSPAFMALDKPVSERGFSKRKCASRGVLLTY